MRPTFIRVLALGFILIAFPVVVFGKTGALAQFEAPTFGGFGASGGESDKRAEPSTPTNPFATNLTTEVAPSLPEKLRRSYTDNPVLMVVQIIRILLSFVAIGLVGLLVYAGYMWMTAAGNEDKVDTAKSTIKNAVIGLIIIMMSWSLSTYIIRRIQVATKSYGGGSLLPATGSFLQENTGGFVGPGGLLR